MLSLGGCYRYSLFLSSGYTIARGGPLGAILSYLVGAVVLLGYAFFGGASGGYASNGVISYLRH